MKIDCIFFACLFGILLAGCSDKDDYEVVEKFALDKNNFAEIARQALGEQFEIDEIQKLEYIVSGRVNGKEFKKSFKAGNIAPCSLHIHSGKVYIFALRGLLFYEPAQEKLEWIFKEEGYFLTPGFELYDFSSNKGRIYGLGHKPLSESFDWFAIDIDERNISRHVANYGDMDKTDQIRLSKEDGEIIAETAIEKLQIIPLENGGFEFVELKQKRENKD